VLILDGWDEISISVAEDFKSRVSRMLEQVRAEYLSSYGVSVRVILTGRPSNDVTGSNFLRDRTPVLTIRPLQPAQLRKFVQSLDDALKARPIPNEDADAWYVDPEKLAPVLTRYEQDFTDDLAVKTATSETPRRNSGTAGSMEVVGLPLLAHLAVRVISTWQGSTSDLLASSTALYRTLTDLTVQNAGKAPYENEDLAAQARVSGVELRELLRRTASAMTVSFPREYIGS
jgi:hypothetical protein